jgi:hypothetical protein
MGLMRPLLPTPPFYKGGWGGICFSEIPVPSSPHALLLPVTPERMQVPDNFRIMAARGQPPAVPRSPAAPANHAPVAQKWTEQWIPNAIEAAWRNLCQVASFLLYQQVRPPVVCLNLVRFCPFWQSHGHLYGHHRNCSPRTGGAG